MILSAMPHHILGFGSKTRLLILIIFHVMKRLEILRNKRKSKENQKEQNLLFTRWLFTISLTINDSIYDLLQITAKCDFSYDQ